MTTSLVTTLSDEVLDEIERINLELTKLNCDVRYMEIPTIQAIITELRQLRADNHALRKDADRYRWLRQDRGYYPEENMLRGGKELDEGIDAEMELTP